MAELRLKSTGTIKLFENDNTSNITIASPASLGADRTITLPDASVTLASGTMLATDGSGASLTALNASELGSGTVPTARLGSGTASSSTVLYGDQTYKAEPGGGLANADQWRLTTGFTGDALSGITSNWEQNDTTGFSVLGSSMTESSGIFSFPSTGYWMVGFYPMFNINGDNRYYDTSIQYTPDDGTYTSVTETSASITQSASSTTYQGGFNTFLFDITDVSNQKVRFRVDVSNTATLTMGHTDKNTTYTTFMRLADT